MVFSPNVLMERNTGLSGGNLFLIKKYIQSPFNDLFDCFIVVYVIEYGPLNSFDQPFPAHFLFHPQNSYTAVVSLFRINFLVKDKGDICLDIRTNAACPVQETFLVSIRSQNDAMRRHGPTEWYKHIP